MTPRRQRAQAQYQAMDAGFVGLIVSCFNSSPAPDCSNRLQVIAFQSVQGAEASYDFDFDGLDSPTREALQASADGSPSPPVRAS